MKATKRKRTPSEIRQQSVAGAVAALTLLSVDQVADAIGASKRTVYELVKAKALAWVPVGKRGIRFRPADVEHYIASRRVASWYVGNERDRASA